MRHGVMADVDLTSRNRRLLGVLLAVMAALAIAALLVGIRW
jgi:hypothetical protein